MAGLRTQNGRIGEQQMGKTPPSPCAPTAPSRPRHRLCLAVLTPQHELLSNTMALITSYCGAMRTHEHQMALITSECVPFTGDCLRDQDPGKTLPLSCVFTDLAAKTLPFLSVLRPAAWAWTSSRQAGLLASACA